VPPVQADYGTGNDSAKCAHGWHLVFVHCLVDALAVKALLHRRAAPAQPLTTSTRALTGAAIELNGHFSVLYCSTFLVLTRPGAVSSCPGQSPGQHHSTAATARQHRAGLWWVPRTSSARLCNAITRIPCSSPRRAVTAAVTLADALADALAAAWSGHPPPARPSTMASAWRRSSRSSSDWRSALAADSAPISSSCHPPPLRPLQAYLHWCSGARAGHT
jgi:hypothetical protein